MMRWAALKNDGGTIWASVSPLENPCWKEVFACAASAAWFPETAGDKGAVPVTKRLFNGALFSSELAIVAGNMSVNKPNPPRITVLLPAPNGLQAKPMRGCQLMLVYLLKAW